MREILFKGKRVDNGVWVFGDYFNTSKSEMCNYMPTIIENGGMNRDDFHLVIPETVSQYTGLKDKNGNKIFEGNILKGGLYESYIVKWDVYSAEWNITAAYINKFEIIGNIHDND